MESIADLRLGASSHLAASRTGAPRALGARHPTFHPSLHTAGVCRTASLIFLVTVDSFAFLPPRQKSSCEFCSG